MLLVSVGCSNEDYELFATINGNVVDAETSEPIANASVMIMPGNQTVQTDAAGNFYFSDLETRQYTLLVQKNEYQANRKSVNAVSGQNISVFITLEKIPTE